MPYKVKPIINETILNLYVAIQCDAVEDMLTSYLASFKVGNGSTVTTECFNAADAQKLIKDCHVIQVKLLEMKFVEKQSQEVAISEKKKVCGNLKGVIDTKYSNFDGPVFQNMKWFDLQTWDQKRQEAAQITSFYEHFKEPLDHANFQLNICLKEFEKFKNYVHVNHEGKKGREIWKQIYKTKQLEYPNLAKISELMMCFSGSNASVERAFNLLTMLLTDQRLTNSHEILIAILNIKINNKVFTENEILVAAVKSFMEKHREAVFEENKTVSQASEEDGMTAEDQNFSVEDDSEDEWDKYVYENVTQKKCGSDTYNEMEATDDLETVDKWNGEYDNNFSVQNNEVMMHESWNHFDSDEDKSFNPLDYNIQLTLK